MSTLQLSMMDDDPWFINQKLFNQLSEFLQPNSSLPAASIVDLLDDLFPSHRNPQDEPAGEPIEDPCTFFWNIWEPFHVCARQIPHNHPSQEKLVACLKLIRQTTSSKTAVVHLASYHGSPEGCCRLWQDMHCFGGKFWEMARFMLCESGTEDQWRNMMAYAARLTRDGIADLSFFGKQSLAAALGYAVVQADRRGRSGHDVLAMDFSPGSDLDENVAIAADWIAYAGGELFEKYNEVDGDAVKHDFGWQFWEQRFGEIVADERINEQTRRTAEDAKEKMEDLKNGFWVSSGG